MEKATNAVGEAANHAREMQQRLDDYVALAVRIYERLISEEKAPFPAPLTVGEGSIRVEVERSKKRNHENIG